MLGQMCTDAQAASNFVGAPDSASSPDTAAVAYRFYSGAAAVNRSVKENPHHSLAAVVASA